TVADVTIAEVAIAEVAVAEVAVAGAGSTPPEFKGTDTQPALNTALATEAEAPASQLDSAPASEEVSLQRRVFNLAWPVISENFLQTLLGIVDTLMVASLGAAALAGVGSAIQVMFFIIAALSAVSVGSSVLVAQAYGAKRLDRASIFAKQSLVLSLLISIPLVLVGLFASGPIISIFMMEPDVSAIGAEYLQVTMGTVAVLTLVLLGGGVMRGLGDSRTPMLITLFANVINVVLTYGLIFGAFGMPEMGAVGSAWGTFISRLVGFIILMVVMWRGVRGVSIRGLAGWFPRLESVRNILKIGFPAASEQLLISTAFLTMSIVVAQLGTEALAAHRIAMNAMSVSFLPGIGFGLAATALVGQSIGAQRSYEGLAVARISTTWALIWMGVLGTVFFIYAEGIISLFSDDPAVIAMGAAGLRPVALAQPFWAVFFVQSGAMRGTGNTGFPLRVNSTSIWVSVIIGAIGIQFFGLGLEAVWGSFLITAPITAVILWRKFQSTIQSGDLVTAIH
ncbi:MAG: MATE family efflux transporter, partial [Litorilinea sp.]